MWHDSFLSMCFDRPCMSSVINPYSLISFDQKDLNFEDCTHHLTILIQQLCSKGTNTADMHCEIVRRRSLIDTLRRMQSSALPHLREEGLCSTRSQHVEYHMLRIYGGYITLLLSRSDSSKHTCPKMSSELIEFPRGAVESYLQLPVFSKTITRMWAFVHMALSCSMTLLDYLGQFGTGIVATLRRLIAALTDEATTKLAPSCSESINLLKNSLDSFESRDLR